MKLAGGEVDFYPYIAIGIITNFFNLFSILPLALFRVQEKPLSVTIINIIRGICSFTLTIILVVVYHFKVLGVLYANMLIAIAFALIYLYITYKNSIWHYDWSQIKIVLRFSLPLLPGSLSYYLVSMSDRILINKYIDLNSLGIYSTAATIALLLNIISYGGYKAFEPYLFKTYSTTGFKDKFIVIYKNFFFILLMGACALSLFAKEFFQLFSDIKYHEAYFYVPLILIGVLASSLSTLYGTVITAQGKTIVNSLISITGGVVSITLNILLLPHIGLMAACLSSAVSMSTMLVLAIYFSKLRISFNETFLSVFGVSIILYLSIYKLTIDDRVISILVKSIIYLVILFSINLILKINIMNIFKRKARSLFK
jgi:O-antigen/teichoic acid export membrane protein